MSGGTHKFLTLDGLRGIAAIAVVSLHAGDVLGGELLQRAYLAVDLFFVMSGIVLAYAYDRRLAGGMTAWQFMSSRVIRLYPLYILGTILFTAGIAIGLSSGVRFELWTVDKLVQAAPLAIFMLPSHAAGFSGIYPLNAPAWSLMFELIVNGAYAFFFPWLTTRVLLAVMGLSALGLIGIAWTGSTLGIGVDWADFYGGFPRVFWSFPAGVLLFRLLSAGRLPRIRVPAPLLMFASLAIFAPRWPALWIPWWDLLAILVLLPLLAWAGMVNEPRRGARLYAWLGLISYAVYMLHTPVYHVLRKMAGRVAGSQMESLVPWIGIFLLALVALTGWLAALVYDRPVRSWLQRRFLRGSPNRDDAIDGVRSPPKIKA